LIDKASNSNLPGSTERIDVKRFENALVRLLRAYTEALAFATNLPAVGLCRVDRGAVKWRLCSRFFTELYVQTHIQDRLGTILRTLELEILAAPAESQAKRLSELASRLKRGLGMLPGWGRLRTLLTRIPPVSAALPVISAALASYAGGEQVAEQLLRAGLVLLVTALSIWVLIVWPSVRMGFRVKRAIFSGGVDLHHPFWNVPGVVRWSPPRTGRKLFEKEPLVFRGGEWRYEEDSVLPWGRTRRDATSPRVFPRNNVYQLEADLFESLGRGRPSEAPIDMLLGFPLYLGVAFLTLSWIAVAAAATDYKLWVGDLSGTLGAILLVLLALFVTLVTGRAFLQALRNHRARSLAVARVLGVVGLYLSPSINAVVVRENEASLTLAVDERLAMWEAEAQLTDTLFAAEARDEAVATGLPRDDHELPQFVEQIGSRFPDGVFHVIIHASSESSTAAKHLSEQPRVVAHLNDQTREAWFLFVAGLLALNHSQDALASSNDLFPPEQPRMAAILDWITAQTRESRPFVWVAPPYRETPYASVKAS
jgi:hypothetical protein